MALRGTLSDFAPVDLVQYPQRGRRTGELVVASASGECRLYYSKGDLHHATCGDLAGIEALVELLGWSEGEFEFRQGVETAEKSIDLDLQHALMEAVRLRDERDSAQVRQSQAGSAARMLESRLVSNLPALPLLLRATVLDASGAVLAEAGEGDGLPQDFLEPLTELKKVYARPKLQRVFFEDEFGIVVLQALSLGRSLVVATANGTSAGAATVQAARLAQALEEDKQ